MEVADQAEAEIAVPLAVVTVDHRAAVGATEVPESMVLEMVDEDAMVVLKVADAGGMAANRAEGQEDRATTDPEAETTMVQGVIAPTVIDQRKVRNWKPKPLKRFPMAFSF